MKCIAIDDGHGMETAGKRTPVFPDGTVMRENEFNNAVAVYLEKELKNCGFETIRVSPENTDTPLETRVQRANNAKADCYISIHANAYGTEWNEACGIETWVFEGAKNGGDTCQLAEALQSSLVKKTGAKNRGVKTSGALYVLNATKMPAALVECGFMTNLKEAELLKDENYRLTCAKALCYALCSFFAVDYNKNNTNNNNDKCPQWKLDGENYLRKNGFINNSHDPLEVLDYGALGIILQNVINSKFFDKTRLL